jgi:hypothetical protein
MKEYPDYFEVGTRIFSEEKLQSKCLFLREF